MGFVIQPNAPSVTHQGRTFYIGAWLWSSGIVPDKFRIAVLEDVPQHGLTIIWEVPLPNGVLAEIQKQGGGVKFIQWLIAAINAFFQQLFGSAPVVTEPTTEAEAQSYVTGSVNKLTISVVNGVPVVK